MESGTLFTYNKDGNKLTPIECRTGQFGDWKKNGRRGSITVEIILWDEKHPGKVCVKKPDGKLCWLPIKNSILTVHPAQEEGRRQRIQWYCRMNEFKEKEVRLEFINEAWELYGERFKKELNSMEVSYFFPVCQNEGTVEIIINPQPITP